MKTVLTHGTFDVPHMGHAIFLDRAKKLGDFLIVGLSSDEYALSQGKKTVYSYVEREAILNQFFCVDLVYKNDQSSMRWAVATYAPDIIVIGSDWGDKYFKQIGCSPDWLAQHGVVLTYLPYTKEISASDIKRRLK